MSSGNNGKGKAYRNNFSLSTAARNELYNVAEATAGNAYNKASQLGQSAASSNSGNSRVLGSLRNNVRNNNGSLPSLVSGNSNGRSPEPGPNNWKNESKVIYNSSAGINNLNNYNFPNNNTRTPAVEQPANAKAPWVLPGNNSNYNGGLRLRKHRKSRKSRKNRKSRKSRKN
jgi:hypothetical protein